MSQPNPQTTREFAKLAANLARTDINNSHVTPSKLKNASQTPDQTEGSLLQPL